MSAINIPNFIGRTHHQSRNPAERADPCGTAGGGTGTGGPTPTCDGFIEGDWVPMTDLLKEVQQDVIGFSTNPGAHWNYVGAGTFGGIWEIEISAFSGSPGLNLGPAGGAWVTFEMKDKFGVLTPSGTEPYRQLAYRVEVANPPDENSNIRLMFGADEKTVLDDTPVNTKRWGGIEWTQGRTWIINGKDGQATPPRSVVEVGTPTPRWVINNGGLCPALTLDTTRTHEVRTVTSTGGLLGPADGARYQDVFTTHRVHKPFLSVFRATNAAAVPAIYTLRVEFAVSRIPVNSGDWL